ncbi:uncharacterized protein PHACADRAFT_172073, partial [Phanerochaete carnosa HHB-10118-sp]
PANCFPLRVNHTRVSISPLCLVLQCCPRLALQPFPLAYCFDSHPQTKPYAVPSHISLNLALPSKQDRRRVAGE